MAKSYKKTYKKGYKKNYYSKPYNKTGSNLIARAWKSIKECNNSNSAIDFAFKINYAFTACYNSHDRTGVAAINLYEVLAQSDNFNNMIKNWDQVKINGANVRLNICDAILNYADVSQIKSVNVVTGWDRTGISLNNVDFLSNDGNLIPENEWSTTTSKFYRNTIGPDVANGYGCKKGLVNSYQRFSRYESCFPSGMEEKSCYVPTSTLESYAPEENKDPNTSILQIIQKFENQTINDQLTQSNPCLPFEGSIKWKPTLLVGVFSTTIQREAQPSIRNQQYVEWNTEHPTLEDSDNYINKLDQTTIPRKITVNGTMTLGQMEEVFKRYIAITGYAPQQMFAHWNFVVGTTLINRATQENPTAPPSALTQEEFDAMQLICFGPIDVANNTGIILNNTNAWIVENNPYEPTVKNPNAGSTIGKVSQFGDVKPIVFNGEFTIAVTFKQQKGDA